MPTDLLARAKKDFKNILKGGFSEEIKLVSLSPNSIILNTKGLASKHWINFDTDGTPVNSKNAHICLIEEELIANEYPYRDLDKEVNLYNHRVSVKDSSGVLKEYVIKEFYPNETIGGIVCILKDYDIN